ncbi:putative membrane protein [Streptococcus mitis]|uniref:Putative membrane protein n=1 Tax=Streptococcus mitis TaxID=28037 RepID=A0A081QCU0_STRMT|nr:membrane protein [Streptococcus mitis]KEQ40763.1 putative membrane protein [Streptococcus mitis]
MSNIWILLKAQLINFFPINEIRDSGNKKQSSMAIASFGIITLSLFCFVYNILTAKTLVHVGQQDLIPAYMVSVSSFSILFLTVFYSNGILFGSRDMEILLSLPVKSLDIITSKFMFMYLLNFLIGLMFMLPGGIVWILNGSLNVLQIVLYFTSIIFAPLIPMCIAACMGIIVVTISSYFKRKNVIALIFSFAMIGIIGYIAVSAMKSGNEDSIEIMLSKQITELYPISGLFVQHTNFPMYIGMGFYIVLSIVVFYLFVKIASLKYGLLNILANTKSRYANDKVSYERKSVFFALYQKELGRFLSSYMAVLNAGLGVILLCVFSICFLFNSVGQIGNSTGIENINEYLSNLAPVFISSMLSLSCAAASSMSLEGKNIWILKSSPVEVRMILNAKIAVNLTLHLIGYMISVSVFVLKLDMNLIQVTNLIIVPICYSFFITVIGIALNKKYPNYDWDSEMIVVKQSLPVIVTGIIGMIALITPLLLNWLFNLPIIFVLQVVSVVLLVITMGVYLTISKSNFI